ncbi:hypothetical protein ACJJTC_010008 [Scirpophaga incertulas]
MKPLYLVLVLSVCIVKASEVRNIEGRGKAKYALLTNLAIMLAAKIGLYKLFIGIGLVLAGIKAIMVMAWTLALSKHTPSWPHYKPALDQPFSSLHPTNPYGGSFEWLIDAMKYHGK